MENNENHSIIKVERIEEKLTVQIEGTTEEALIALSCIINSMITSAGLSPLTITTTVYSTIKKTTEGV